ncbi:TetR/AcrR family transcriptional regulator [Rhizorhabdus wittichii]|uniref:TetR/AcrR family transcriptional regulator n=1 Tax=Rhizorhabdus wittichii TaxID=160791 RepID=A0A975HDX8_9SPHN|nr:TetR/AcrR family transcriptional regulator [Rhizorhabdus wittichii]QTH20204.1 TetR/AcrR family transcriptional regulator [Rhizorhabdus wittichii]
MRKEEGAEEISAHTWLRGALKTLGEVGIEGVRIEPLAKRLGLTKGSFYWHFKDRDALLIEMLAHWRRRSTLDVIEQIEQGNEAPRARLRKLLHMAIIEERFAKGANNVELAIRLWSRTDERPRQALTEVDELRLRYIRSLFSEVGFDGAQAEARAGLTYSFMRVAATFVGDNKERALENTLSALLSPKD